jgi:opine dehydrogenase
MAADLTLRGYNVNLYEHPSFKENFKATLETGIVKLSGIGPTGTAKINKVTTDMGEALRGVDIINVVIPATGHELFFNEMLPCLEEGQIVVVWAGDFGSLRLAELLRKNCPEKKIIIAETNTLPYGTRLKSPGEVELLLTAPMVTIAGLPSTDTDYVLGRLKEIWPVLVATDNVIVAALSNPNPICHPPGSLLNTGRIQYSKGNFYMYKEGITEATARVIKAVYQETSDLAKALGYQVIQYEERDFRTTCSIMGVAFQAPFDTLGLIGSILGPKSIYDRYITEDLPCGLVPMSQLGAKLGVPTPVIDSIINIGGVVCDENFWLTGRTLDTLGIVEMSKEELLEYIMGKSSS